MLYVFNTCPNWIRTMSTLPYSQKKPEDVDSDAEDHDYDATRYFLMDHPVTPTKRATAEYKPFSPFDD
jgi:hypothetical protein